MKVSKAHASFNEVTHRGFDAHVVSGGLKLKVPATRPTIHLGPTETKIKEPSVSRARKRTVVE